MTMHTCTKHRRWTFLDNSTPAVRACPECPRIPEDFPVQPLTTTRELERASSIATCGTCGRTWDDAEVTSMTPAPSGRCPFEAFHVYDDEQEEPSLPHNPGPYDVKNDPRFNSEAAAGAIDNAAVALYDELEERVGTDAAGRIWLAACRLWDAEHLEELEEEQQTNRPTTEQRLEELERRVTELERASQPELGYCDECGCAGVDTDHRGADGRSVCDECREIAARF